MRVVGNLFVLPVTALSVFLMHVESSLAAGKPEEVVFFVKAQSAQPMTERDFSDADDLAGIFKEFADDHESNVKVRVIQAKNLSTAVGNIQRAIHPGEAVSGVFLFGRGTDERFDFHDDAKYSGEQVAQAVHAALEHLPKSPRLSVYFAGCNCGSKSSAPTKLQGTFLSTFQALDEHSPKPWEQVQVIAHRGVPDANESTYTVRANQLNSWLYTTKIPHVFKSFSLVISRRFSPRNAHAIESILPTLLVAGLYAIVASVVSPHMKHIIENSATLGILALSSATTWTWRQSRSEVVVLHASKGGQITAGDNTTVAEKLIEVFHPAIPESSGALSCSALFSGI